VTPNLSYRANRAFRRLLPCLITLFLAFIAYVPTGIHGFAYVSPSLVFISVFYWSIHRPYLMPAPLVFLFGLLLDILSGGPIGMSSLLLLAVHAVCVSQRRVFVGKAFMLTWWGFILIAIGAAIFSWIVACVYYFSFIGLETVFIQLMLTLCVFPILAWGFGRLQNSLLKEI
jgi:rod shape-determining protein MreD